MTLKVVLIPLLAACSGILRADEAPATCCFDGKALMEAKRLAAAGDSNVVALVKDLRKDAEKRLKDKLWTVTDKTLPAPGGNPHDYVSGATYYWPNPAASNGLPYVARDGEKNPDNDQYDHVRFGRMVNTVRTLSVAYYLTGEERYAARAAEQIRAWFLDEQTGMTPHVKHAQFKKGINDGSPIGIIDVRDLSMVIDGVALLKGSKSWTDADHTRLQKWFREYLEWLTTSDFARKERDATNNHGVWYDAQAASIALFTGQPQLARDICEGAKANRIARQIEPDGRQPRELARTLSLTYTFFNLEAFFRLARIAGLAGVDLWNYRTSDGRSIRQALDWTIPFATGRKQWEHQQIKNNSGKAIIVLLREAAVVYKDSDYKKILDEFSGPGSKDWNPDLLVPPPNQPTRENPPRHPVD